MFQKALGKLYAGLPGQCAVCHRWPAQPVCEACIDRFAQPVTRCRRCALPTTGRTECGRCLTTPPPLDACHAAVSYDYPWSTLVTQFKFHGQAGWGETLATLMRSAPWIEPALDQADLVVPMPLSPQRLAQRGFNQAQVLARQLEPRKCDDRLLLRVRDTSSQAELGLGERLRNVKDAFAVEPLRAGAAKDCRVVVVDDVMTSGASLHGAAHALRGAGASHITALVFARTDEPHFARRDDLH